MIETVSELRTRFANPPMSAKPLAILHCIEGMLRARAGVPHDEEWSPSTEELRDRLMAAWNRMKGMGFGGVVINVDYHNYLEDESHWRVLRECVRTCREQGLRVWIYDERGYPSGAAGNLVLRDNPEYEVEVLARSIVQVEAGETAVRPPTGWRYAVKAVMKIEDQRSDVTEHIDEDGYLRLTVPEPCLIERYDVRSGFEGTHAALNVHAVRRYINVLNPDAVNKFYNLTYKAYIDRLCDDLEWVEAFFTDEPSFMAAYHCDLPERYESNVPVRDAPMEAYDRLPQIPWRESLPQDFKDRWGYDLLAELSSLFDEGSQEDLRVRHDFYQLISELYAETFFDRIQSPLREYGIPLSGHVLAEESIVQQVAAEGNLIGNLRNMDKPGIDMLTSSPDDILNGISLLSCKYGSSAAHVSGRSDIMCEVSDWAQRNQGAAASMDERRGALATQLALGITTFTSYYGWKGFEHEEIHELMDFCGRMHLAVRYGTHVAPIALLYPMRTAWTYYQPTDRTLTNETQPRPLASMDGALMKIARSLLGRQMDFDFVDSQGLTDSESAAGDLQVANESYEMLVIPPEAVLCPNDIEAVRRAADAGVRILAFEPLSEIRLPMNRQDTGESPRDVLLGLQMEHAQTVQIIRLDSDWVSDLEQHVQRRLVLSGNTESVLVRRSSLKDGDVFVIVNASGEPVRLGVKLTSPGSAELWNPTNGSAVDLPDEIEIEGYGARIIVCESDTSRA